MNTEKYKKYTTEDFIHDSQFISWVLHPDKEADVIWDEFLEKYPDKRAEINEASYIIKALQPVEEEIPAGRLELIFEKISSERITRRRRIFPGIYKYAALFLLLAGVAGVLYLQMKTSAPFPITSIDHSDAEYGRVILSDGTSSEFDTRETIIRQMGSGTHLVNKDTLEKADLTRKRDAAAMNQVIIPYGKRSEITLADGTHIWLNSGSQISYRSNLTDGRREVYLSGEAFFDVMTDSDKPFYVITSDVRIRVTGTRFNVTAYSEDQSTTTILESGKVSVGKNALIARTIEVAPGQKVVYSKETDGFEKEDVDLQYANSWVHGYLVFKNEPTTGIFRSLGRYYNRTITSGEGLDEITFSGKLDLKDDLEEVLENIAFASSLVIIREDQGFYLKHNAYEDN